MFSIRDRLHPAPVLRLDHRPDAVPGWVERHTAVIFKGQEVNLHPSLESGGETPSSLKSRRVIGAASGPIGSQTAPSWMHRSIPTCLPSLAWARCSRGCCRPSYWVSLPPPHAACPSINAYQIYLELLWSSGNNQDFFFYYYHYSKTNCSIFSLSVFGNGLIIVSKGGKIFFFCKKVT